MTTTAIDAERTAIIGELGQLLSARDFAPYSTDDLRRTLEAVKAERARYKALGFVDEAMPDA